VDRRFLLFVALSLLLLIANTVWNARNAPKQPARVADAKQAAEADPKSGDADAAKDAGADEAAAEDAKGEDSEAGAADGPAEDEAAAEEDDAEGDPAPAAEVAAEFITLGSVDPASPYRMGVTFTNVGAAVKRIELASPRYLDLHDRGGYLGHLELRVGDGRGLLVQSVVPGTPAAEAGLKVGDRILEAGASEKTLKTTASPTEFAKIIDAMRPGRSALLEIEREGQQQTLTVKLRRGPLDVVRPESENIRMRGEEAPAGYEDTPSLLLTLQQLDDLELKPDPVTKELRGVDLISAAWEVVDRGDDAVTFEHRLPELGLKVTKRYELAEVAKEAEGDPDAPVYHLTLTVTIANEAGSEKMRAVSYQLAGPNGLPVEGWWYATKSGRSGGGGLRDIVGRYANAKPVQKGGPSIVDGSSEAFDTASLAYMGVDAQYFAAALIPVKKDFEEEWISTVVPVPVGPKLADKLGGARLSNVSFNIVSDAAELEPGDSVTHSYQVFAGPKRPDLLAQYYAAGDKAYSLNDFVYYGWFGGVARAMVGMLHIFYSWVGNYGIAIIMLTVLVRGCMFPISRGQAKSMARMQELRPEMERIKEKFKGDQQKQAKAMQDLYRKNNVNPLAGCLPMLIQLPVFIGLYRGLAVDVELRQAPLFGQAVRWCSNLAAPDMLYNWSAFMPQMITRGEGLFGLGPYLNVLPLITIALFLLQQKLFMPPATDEQTAMQQKIMKYMMVFMGLLFYKSPSGLCLYFIASSLWGIAERKMIPPATATNAVVSAPRAPTSGGDSTSGGKSATGAKAPSGGKRKR
jgi:YidC/Oxa1 family membrane protein insertase